MTTNLLEINKIGTAQLRARLWLGMVLVCFLLGGFCTVRAEVMKCVVCDKIILENYYIFKDKSLGGEKKVCKECEKLEAKCFLCSLPVRGSHETLKDGRVICARDYREGVHEDTEAKKICEEVRDELNRAFSRFMTYPGQNVVLATVDKYHLESLFKTTGYDHCVSIFGATQSNPLANDTYMHSISILSDLKKPRLMAVCVHEYTHAWFSENVSKQRRAVISQETVEGLCELMAYKFMENHRETYEMEVIKSSDYTKGQITALLEAENRYGLNMVLEWMKSGEDAKLDVNNLDRVRFVAGGQSRPVQAMAAIPVAQQVAVVAAPTALMLKGISGSSQRRFALINDSTFEAMEKGKVRLGQTNVSLRCLEIRPGSVVVQLDGASEKKELFLRVQ
ncbi:MAG: zinc-binding protein [Pedosphaera sp.]|nr:zinc-binding protein [Pedosphaera sp.]